MLKYELEHEKLAMKLEEERKSHKECQQCIREQQMKIDNLSSLVILSDRGSSAEGDVSTRLYGREECISNHVTQRYSFATPLKGFSNAFVAGRSNHLSLIESSPVPDDFVNIADEDLWMRLNKGHTTLDFDLLMKTPNRKYSSLASNDISKVSCSVEYYKEEVETLKRQLESALLEKDELEKKHSEQVSLNKQLMVEISELENEATLIKQIPQRMLGSVANCQDAYKMILSNIKSFAADQKSSNAKLLSCTTDIGMHLFLTLENHLSRAMDGHEIRTGGSSVLQDQSRILAEKMNCAISALISSECSIRTEGPALEDAANAGGKMEFNNQVVEVAKIKYRSLERECSLLKGERDSLTQTLSMSAQSIALLVSEREEIVKTLNKETHSRKNLEEELRRFGLAFAQRQGLFASLCSEFKSNTEKLRVSNSVSIPEQVRI